MHWFPWPDRVTGFVLQMGKAMGCVPCSCVTITRAGGWLSSKTNKALLMISAQFSPHPKFPGQKVSLALLCRWSALHARISAQVLWFSGVPARFSG